MKVIPIGNDNALAKRLKSINAAKKVACTTKTENADDTVNEVPAKVSENEREMAGKKASEAAAESPETTPKRKFSSKKKEA